MRIARAGLAGSVVALLASVVTGCGTGHAAARPASDVAVQRPAAVDSHVASQHTTHARQATETHGTAASRAGGVQHATDDRTGTNNAGTAAARAHDAELRGSAPYVWQLRAAVAPQCVKAGGAATVTVRTAANAALAFVAVYAGDKSGAAKPFGYGYGGNADGYSNDAGQWASTWTIRADAPRGPAKVTVVVASHQTTKQVDVPFTVVDPVTGHC